MWLENDIGIHSVQAYRRKMIEICEKEGNDKVYNAWYIKKLKNRCGDFIWFSEDVGKESFIFFKSMAEHIIRESRKEEEGCAQELTGEEKNWILKA